jgi:hypothetical protein
MKSDVKPVTTSASNAVLFTGPTRLRGLWYKELELLVLL